MAARNRMPPWHENVRLSNGRDVLIRPIRPEDAVPLRAGFALPFIPEYYRWLSGYLLRQGLSRTKGFVRGRA